MKFWLGLFLLITVTRGETFDSFITSARAHHGEAGAKAAQFLVDNMPAKDRDSITNEFLIANLELAFKARSEFPWAAAVPEAIFLNDVLSYAVFDEPRDPWRAEFYQKASTIAKEANAKTATEAAQALNKNIFKLVNVHYNTGRKRPNQSAKESIEIGKATCTGLAIILVEACRSIGIPARAVGTPMWTNERGNHTWVEVWDGDWHFTGADEYDAAGLDRGWFVGDASTAKADVPRYSIYATSWKRDGLTFPMVWSHNSDVSAVNVTSRYARKNEADEFVEVGVRLWDKAQGKRLEARLCIFDGHRRECGVATTKAGTADLNDMPRFKLKSGTEGTFRFTIGGEAREISFGPLKEKTSTIDAAWASLPTVLLKDEFK